MRKLIMVIFLFSPMAVLAQQGINPEIMQQLQEMATCVATIDQNEMKALEKESNKFEAEVKGLCKSGKRDKAQKRALEFSKKIINSPALITMRKCTENVSASLKGMVPDMSTEKMVKDYSNKHVCDEI
ncbi:hypothetical protein BMS3Bbin11_00345 [bacterium BMS3Bbin11]|nr:hypothetical protein BMS3Abin11_00068 [bacterium BMS3Abin11]GBE45264.1 hypothetical protein BMS3Bbin11_00345 [bacterium BMS3Bbin11]HDH08144.1 hypothetical protein [Gammaproteobacteria bacterium]